MNGRAEVAKLRQRLDATFKRISDVGSNIEVQSDFAKYLCVLVSGFLEKAVAQLALEHAKRTGAPSLQRFVERNTRRFTNANAQRLKNLLGSFDPIWRRRLENLLIDEYKDAVDSIVDLRNTIAHGGSVGVTYQRVSDYYIVIKKVVDEIADLCAPI